MRWPAWLFWWHHPPPDSAAARRAHAEAQRKLAESRQEAPGVRRQIDSFTRAVNRALGERP